MGFIGELRLLFVVLVALCCFVTWIRVVLLL